MSNRTRATDDAMGPYESAVYRARWRAAYIFRSFAQGRSLPAISRPQMSTDGQGFEALRLQHIDDLPEDDEPGLDLARARPQSAFLYPPSAPLVAATLLLARELDRAPGLRNALSEGSPVLVVDVRDSAVLDALETSWRSVIFPVPLRLMNLETRKIRTRDALDGLYLFRRTPLKGFDRTSLERFTLAMLGYALPLVAISPSARSHLPAAVLAAASHRIDVPELDAHIVRRTIRIVTGDPRLEQVDATKLATFTMPDLAIAVRYDRSAPDCLVELRRVSALRFGRRTRRTRGRHLVPPSGAGSE
jgi:cell division protease FtsH